jgi:pimeloyl-ACP methyl ester carboxylesterase
MKILKTAFFVFSIVGLGLILILLLSYRSDLSPESLMDKYAGPASYFMKVNNMNVHVQVKGEGEAIFLLHGSFASSHTWEAWEQELNPYFMTISIDLPGHGLTGPDPQKRYQVADFAELVFEVASQLGIREFHVAGNSMGGEVALAMATRFPERILSLNLIDAAGAPQVKQGSKGSGRPWIFGLAENKFFGGLLLKCTPRVLFAMNLRQVYANHKSISPEQVDRYYELMRRSGNRQATLDRMAQRQRAVYDFSQLKMPVLIMWGEEDNWISPANADRFLEVIPDAIVKMYANLGHVPMEESPTETVGDYLGFLGIQADVDYFSAPKYYSYGNSNARTPFPFDLDRAKPMDHQEDF